MKKVSLSALLAAGILAGGMASANAADLGGNCCADLEERIAELEATTARKGNRKVSLTISGWVTQQITFWDDGRTKNAYITDTGDAEASNVQFTGSAKISPDWSAGYVLHIEAISNDSFFETQAKDNGGRGVFVYRSFWFVKSETLGKLSLGLQSGAADNQAINPDASGTAFPANYVIYEGSSFFLIRSGDKTKTRSGTNWGSLASCGTLQGAALAADCEAVPTNNARYDTPTFAGFSGSASWGENDEWALSGRYTGESSLFKFNAAVAYFDANSQRVGNKNAGAATPNNGNDVLGNGFRRSFNAVQVGAYLQHVPTGLFVYGAYGKDFNDSIQSSAEVANFGKKSDGDSYYVKAGIRQKWNSLGHTVLFGEYGENNDKQTLDLLNAGVTGSNITQWGLGIVQDIDAAALTAWVMYRHLSADQTCRAGAIDANCFGGLGGAAGKVGFSDLDVIKAGAVIFY